MTRVPVVGKVRLQIRQAADAYADTIGQQITPPVDPVAVASGFQMPGLSSLGTMKTWNADGGNSCDVCDALDGVHVGTDETFDGLDGPPAHPNCACTISYSTPNS
jgi:hypothetical protein